MKNVTTRTMIFAAAALTLGMTTTYAQSSSKMKAEIPFSFTVGKVQYPAGSYETTVLSSAGGARVFTLANVNTGVTQIAVAAGSLYAANSMGNNESARLVFRCGSVCTLAQVWPGSAANGMFMSTPYTKGNEQQHLAVIGLRPVNAD